MPEPSEPEVTGEAEGGTENDEEGDAEEPIVDETEGEIPANDPSTETQDSVEDNS